MKILSVIQRFYPVLGGAESQTKIFMDYLSKDHQIHVMTTNALDIERFWNINSREIKETSPIDYPVDRFRIVTPTEKKFDKNLVNFPMISNYPGPFSPDLWKKLFLKKLN